LSGEKLLKKSLSLLLLIFLGLFTFLSATVQTVAAQTPVPQTNADANDALCLPGQDSIGSMNCLTAGPAQVLGDLAKKGLTFPPEAVAIVHPPYDLFKVPFTYAQVAKGVIPLYASIDDAINGVVGNKIPDGIIRYVAYSHKTTTAKGVFYQIATGDWISGDYITKVSVPYLQGYLIKQYPSVPFGWVLTNEAISHTAPDQNSPVNQKAYTRLDLIHYYDSVKVNDTEWVMIGQNEWMDHRFLGIVFNKPTPPDRVTNSRWIEVNLYEQVLTVYDQGKMIFATLISTGVKPFYTQPGTFQIYKKIEHQYMTGAFEADRSDYYYLEEVPYIMYFDQARALHGAYWNTFYGYQRSHGCVNLSVGDAHWLYDWANEGDTVYVWDPSGKTPTDPSLYGSGGF
jgi:lipoprotein-anchoring transpeptidase ErfK/SrfK